MARLNEEQLKGARDIISSYVSPQHCESFNGKIPLSVLTCNDKFEQVNIFHEQLLTLCNDIFADFEFCKPFDRIKLSEKLTVFVIWLQNEMPEIVAYCIDELKKQDINLVIITEHNVDEYIFVHRSIRDAYDFKHICAADYSDYLRVKLLEQYEGIYLDASSVLISDIPDYVLTFPYWSVKGNYQKNTSTIAMLHFAFGQVYALGGCDNTIYSYVTQMLEYYYAKYDYAFSYYMIYYFFEWLYRHNTFIKAEIDYLKNNNEDVEQFAYHLNKPQEAKNYTNTFFYKLRSSDKYNAEHYEALHKIKRKNYTHKLLSDCLHFE